MIKKLGLYYRTIKHLKPIQIRYQLWYRLRDKIRKLTGHSYPLSIPKKGHALNLEESIPSSVVGHPSTRTFSFLNQSHTFEESIDWNFSRYGKLWAYNLNYFDYLQQPGMTKEQGLELIREFIKGMEDNREGLEPYPISLRAINWITFVSRHEINDPDIDGSLYAQYRMLMDNPEYHLLGNHLLENGFSLLFGGYYFRDQKLFSQAKEIIYEQLDEQILDDGGHFERSPMYHNILLERLMDCINITDNNWEWREDRELRSYLRKKAEKMLGWMEEMAFDGRDDGRRTTDDRHWSSVIRHLPLFNDSVAGIAPSVQELQDYAARLGLEAKKVNLSESGYRKFRAGHFEIICDVGPIGPDYQPAHAHSDTLSFILYCDGKPVFIDTGISTYENNDRRHIERGTVAHNTVMINGEEQSEVWSAFRVGRRARPFDIRESDNALRASHDGYSHLGITHTREWTFEKDEIIIRDSVSGNSKNTALAFFHIHPDITPVKKGEHIFQVGDIRLYLDGCEFSSVNEWSYAKGFNRLQKGYKLEIGFHKELTSRIVYQE